MTLRLTNKVIKSVVMLLYGLFNLIPIFHEYQLYKNMINIDGFNIDVMNEINGLLYMLLFFILGLGFYYSGFPERFFPKKFDIWMNSHTIWHLFVTVALTFGYYGGMDIYQQRKLSMLNQN